MLCLCVCETSYWIQARTKKKKHTCGLFDRFVFHKMRKGYACIKEAVKVQKMTECSLISTVLNKNMTVCKQHSKVEAALHELCFYFK